MQPGTQALYTLPGSSITNVTDLKGKRIGVNALNNIGTLLISSVLEEYGLSPREVHFVTVNFPQMGAALKQHLIAWPGSPSHSVAPIPRAWACRSFATSTRARRRTSRSDGTS